MPHVCVPRSDKVVAWLRTSWHAPDAQKARRWDRALCLMDVWQ